MSIGRIIRYLWRQTVGRLLWWWYGPKTILDLNDDHGMDFKEPVLSGRKYLVINAPDSVLFTDTVHTIAISKDRKLIPDVSWQYERGRQKVDQYNYYLNGKIFPMLPPVRVKGTVISLLTGGSGINNYYHWLFDVLPRLKLIQDAFSIGPDATYLLPDNSRPFQKETLSLLNISPDKQFTSLEVNHIRCDRCLATSYPSYNDMHREVPYWIIDYLRETFLPLTNKNGNENSPFIYISRNDSLKKRFLIGEEKLASELVKRGFRIVELSNLKVVDQISLFKHAEMIVGVHGAGFANLAFCNKGCKVLELFSPDYKPKLYELICNHLELKYHKMFLGNEGPAESKQHLHLKLTKVKMSEILMHIDELIIDLRAQISD